MDEKKSELESSLASSSIYRAGGGVTFDAFGLPKQLGLNVVTLAKWTTPTQIQADAIPVILSDKRPNFIGQAKSGSGKTGAYALAMLSRVNADQKWVQSLILVPTRELANQVHFAISRLATDTGITVKKAVPDEPRGVVTEQVVVGTPGTVIAKLKHGEIDGSKIIMFICDEADLMLAQQGFADQTLNIKSKCTHKQLQSLLFSATFPPFVEAFAKRVAPQAISVRLKTEEISLQNVRQFWVETPNTTKEKYERLVLLYGLLNIGQSIIFMDSIKSAKELCNQMRQGGYTVSLLHGKDLSPAERDAVMKDFTTGKSTVLIATNVLARGVDVPSVNMIVNYELPHRKGNKPDFETYSHRVGRAGRFGRPGAAVNFVTNHDEKLQLADIAKHFNHPVLELKFDDLPKLESTIKAALTPN